MFVTFEPTLFNSHWMQNHSGHNEACFQKAAMSRGRRRILRGVRARPYAEMPEVLGTHIGQFVMLPVSPNVFDRV